MNYIGLPFTTGDRITHNGEFGEIKLIDADNNLAAIYYDTKRLVQYSLSELVEDCRNRSLCVIQTVAPMPAHVKLTNNEMNTVRYREAYCKAAHQLSHPCSQKLLEELIPRVAAEIQYKTIQIIGAFNDGIKTGLMTIMT